MRRSPSAARVGRGEPGGGRPSFTAAAPCGEDRSGGRGCGGTTPEGSARRASTTGTRPSCGGSHSGSPTTPTSPRTSSRRRCSCVADPQLTDRSDAAPGAWLFTVTRHIVVDRWRSAAARHETGPVDVEGQSEADRTGEVLDRWLIADALAALSPEHREVIAAAYYEGRSVAEIARHPAHPGGHREVAPALRTARPPPRPAGEGGESGHEHEPPHPLGRGLRPRCSLAGASGRSSRSTRGCQACRDAVVELAACPGCSPGYPPARCSRWRSRRR